MSLIEIKKIISGFEGKQRAELVDFYFQRVKVVIENSNNINSKRISLIQDVCTFISKDERRVLINLAINKKISQIRNFILENQKLNFAEEKTQFCSISKYMQVLIEEVSNTFSEPLVSESIAKEFHEKLQEEFSLIFISDEKFNSAGNQLLIDIKAFQNAFSTVTNDKLYQKIKNNFQTGKVLSDEKISEIYSKIISK